MALTIQVDDAAVPGRLAGRRVQVGGGCCGVQERLAVDVPAVSSYTVPGEFGAVSLLTCAFTVLLLAHHPSKGGCEGAGSTPGSR